MTIITLLTDFGLQDGYPGIMKGVIFGIAPHVDIADITHFVSPQNVREGALAVGRSYRYFPAGTIHVAVVDPGVGTHRRPIAFRAGNHTFVGPDNGLFSLVIEEARLNGWPLEVVVLDNPSYWLPNPSNVFHGRDIFAPAAAWLAAGVALHDLGTKINDPVMLDFPRPVVSENEIAGEVIAIDHFGNLSTNIEDGLWSDWGSVEVLVAGKVISGLVKTFGERPVGDLVALFGTDHDLSISIVNGNALEQLKASLGTKVIIRRKSV